MAVRHAVEEVASLRYMLRCLGVRVDSASHVYGDNLGVIQNATIKDSLLKKKHVAISYHKVREAVAAAIIIPIKSPPRPTMQTASPNPSPSVITQG